MTTIQEKVHLLADNEPAVKKATAWSGMETKNRLLLASMYANREERLEAARLRDLADWIKGEVGMWSYMRTNFRYTAAANLDLYTGNPKEAFQDMMTMYDALISSGFNRSNSTYLAAMTVVSHPEKTEPEKLADRAMQLYKVIRSRHPFLTGENDYPLIVLLAAMRTDSPEELSTELSNTYRALSDWGFRKGNDLQGLTHVLSLDDAFTHEERLDKIKSLCKAWEEQIHRVKPAVYSELGLLALRGAVPEDIRTVKKAGDAILEIPSFRWQKDLAWQIGVQFTAAADLADSPLKGHMLSTLAMLQQADTAIMLTTIGAVTVTTSGN
ncbi:DUF4003 family protein [Alteribacter natronophilus]|uniref:DUF4003 family protein n=1 Tax=Alteribacter natronophilus TaxID=2583810 RepID=UPI00110DB66B|nr:DUF4003 family protein [Alteribacter natronophilus]TMW70654.1 DUF4003 family protein [Alteribacter natronophilus]